MNNSYKIWFSSLDNYWKLKIVRAPFKNWTDKQKVLLKKQYNSLEIEKIVSDIRELSFYDTNSIDDMDFIDPSSFAFNLMKSKLKKENREVMTNIPDLSPLKNLLEFHIGKECKFKNIDNIKTCTNIEYLSIQNFKIDNIEFVSSLHNLKRLELFHTKVSNLNCIVNLVNLEHLKFTKHFSDTEIRINDLSPLSKLTKLKTLHISEDVKDIELIKNLSNLEEFSCRKIESFEHLRNLKKLKKLRCAFKNKNTVSDLSPLSELRNLEHLDISFSNISDLSPIYNLKNLKLLVYKDTPLDEEHKNFWKRIFGSTEIQKFRKINPNCDLRKY